MILCTICLEPIKYWEGEHVHINGDDRYCHTGDGATALPPSNYCPESSLLNFGMAKLLDGNHFNGEPTQ